MRTRVLCFVLAALFLCLSATALLRSPMGATPQKRSKDPFLEGQSFSLRQVLNMIAGGYSDDRFEEVIAARGITFEVTEAIVTEIQKEGASARKLDTLRKKSRDVFSSGTPGTASTPQQTSGAGPLTLKCSPPECEVLFYQKRKDRTTGGTLTISDLPVGLTVVEFMKDGHEPQLMTLQLAAGASMDRDVTLTPTLSTKEQYGKELFGRLLEALGGDDGLREASSLVGSGELELWDREGRAHVQGSLQFLLKLPELLRMNVTRPSGNFSVVLGTKRGGARFPPDTEAKVRIFRNFQLAAVLSKLHEMEKLGDLTLLAMTAETPEESKDRLLDAESQLERYSITVGRDALPRRIVQRNTTGAGPTLEVSYSDYAPVGKTRYPRRMQFKVDAGAKEGGDFRLKNVVSSPNLTEKDFRTSGALRKALQKIPGLGSFVKA